MPRSATGHRHRRWSLRHPGQPHQPPRSWPYDQSCTNIQPGPPSGGRPIALLDKLSHVAAAAHAPFIAAASPKLLDMASFTEIGVPRDLGKIFESAELIRWR